MSRLWISPLHISSCHCSCNRWCRTLEILYDNTDILWADPLPCIVNSSPSSEVNTTPYSRSWDKMTCIFATFWHWETWWSTFGAILFLAWAFSYVRVHAFVESYCSIRTCNFVDCHWNIALKDYFRRRYHNLVFRLNSDRSCHLLANPLVFVLEVEKQRRPKEHFGLPKVSRYLPGNMSQYWLARYHVILPAKAVVATVSICDPALLAVAVPVMEIVIEARSPLYA